MLHRFTNDHPLIFSDLEVGKHRVQRNVPEHGQVDGATLVLYPGDLIDLRSEAGERYAWLEPVKDEDEKPKRKPRTVKPKTTSKPAPAATAPAPTTNEKD